MEGSVIELSKYRFQRSYEDLNSAKILLHERNLKPSINRSYYAIFHGLRAVTALERFDSSKHSSVIAYFNRTYIKEGIFDKSFSKIIDTAYRLREKSDYEDFFVVSYDMTEEQLKKAEKILEILKPCLENRWGK